MRKTNLVLLISLFVLSEIAFAEGNCPDGMVPVVVGGAVGCMQIDRGQSTAPAHSKN